MMPAKGAAGDRRYKTAARTRTRGRGHAGLTREGPPEACCPFTMPHFYDLTVHSVAFTPISVPMATPSMAMTDCGKSCKCIKRLLRGNRIEGDKLVTFLKQGSASGSPPLPVGTICHLGKQENELYSESRNIVLTQESPYVTASGCWDSESPNNQ